MADPQYKFINTGYGGGQNVDLTADEMPDYFPLGAEVGQNQITASKGKVWTYNWYRKLRCTLQFRSVGSAIVATMGSLANEDVPFVWYHDITQADTATYVMVYDGGEEGFTKTPLTPTLYDFDFPCKEWIPGLGNP